jgi:hypothetical protein
MATGAIAFERDGAVHLRTRNDNDFNGRYPVLAGQDVRNEPLRKRRKFLEKRVSPAIRTGQVLGSTSDERAAGVADRAGITVGMGCGIHIHI